MNRKRKTAVVALLSVFAMTTLFAACEASKNITEVPTDKDYGYNNPDRVYAQPDEGFKIDGKADEEVYKNSKWVYLHNQNGTNTVDLAMTSHFGEKGMYFVYDVTENTPIYVNPDRASYINSGIEMYFAPQGITSMSNDHVYEIDLEATGTVSFKKTSGYVGSWVDVQSTDAIMAYAASELKGGEVNSGNCFGYTIEFFIPWDYVQWLGMNPATMKEETVSVSPVHITSYNYNGTDHEIDRYWYPFATQLGGDGFHNVGQYFKFGKDGVAGTVPVSYVQGDHCTVSGPAAALPGLPVTVTLTPEEGYAVSAFTRNGNDYLKFLNYNEDGSATYTVTCEEGMSFSATAEQVVSGNKTLTGKINLKKAGGDTLSGLSATYADVDGEHTLPLSADGTFELKDLPQAYYTITAEKSGYGRITRGIYLNRNIDTQIDLEYGTFDIVEGSCWDIENANEGYLIKKGGRGVILSKNIYDTVYAEASLHYDDTLAASSNVNDDIEQRSGIRMKFSGGKSWSVTLIRSGDAYGVMYAKHNNDFIFGWSTVYVLNAKEIAKYKSGNGINLGILRDGTTAYIYLDGEIIHTENLAPEGVKADERVQIGFEGFYYNTQPQIIPYAIRDDHANEVAIVKDKEEGATVSVSGVSKVGENVTLVIEKNNASHVLLSLLVNGVEMSGSVRTDLPTTDYLIIAENTSLTLNIEVVYGTPQEITANIAVDGAWNANGIEFTFTNAADETNVKTAVVANNKMRIENMLQGRWLVTANVFGKNVELGSYSVVSTAEKKLDVENVFIGGKKLDPSVIDLSTGSFVYHSSINEDYSIRINEAGDAFLAAKIKLSAEDRAKLLRGGEVSFGMYMTVKDKNDQKSTHWTDIWIKNVGNDNWLTIRTDFGWEEKICNPFTAQVSSNEYSKALFGNGLYFVLQYNATTGAMETYLGSNDYSVKRLRDWKDDANLFPAGGTVVQAGFRDNLAWGETGVSAQVEGFRYGKTLLAALGVAGKSVIIRESAENGTVTWGKNSYTAGENVSCTIAANEGYFIDAVFVNGCDVTALIGADGTLTLNGFTAVELDLNAVFVKAENLATVTLTVEDVWNAEGLEVTLSREGFADITGTVENGKIFLKNVMQGTWTVRAQIFGAPVTAQLKVMGDVNFDLGSFFVYSDQAKGNVNIAEGKLTYHGDAREDVAINTSVEGDAWILGKVSLSKEDFDKIMNGGQVPFGMYVMFSDGTYKYVSLNLSNKSGDMHLCLTDGSWWEDNHTWGNGCSSHLGTINQDNTYTLNKYGEALRGDGLYYILNYNASTGYLSVYYATNPDDVILAKEMGHDGIQNGTIVKFGVNRGHGWGETPVTFNVVDFRYGKTLAEAFGIADQTIEVTGAGQKENGTVTVSETKRGGNVTVTLTPANGYKVETFTVNGQFVDVAKLIDGTYTLEGYLGATLNVEATFAEIVKVSFNLSIVGNKLGVEDNTANGLTATLSDGIHTYSGTVTNGSVAFNNVVTGKGYTLSIEGFVSATNLEVLPVTGIADTLTLVFDTMLNMAQTWNWGDGGTFSGEYGEKYKHTSGATMWYVTKESYNKVMIKANVNTDATGRQGVMVKFGDEYVLVQLETVGGGSSYKISWNDDGGYSSWGTGVKNITGTWDAFIDPLSSEQVAEMKKGELFITLLRDGNVIHGFVNDVYCSTLTLDAKYQNAACQVGFYATDIKVNAEREYYVSANIPAASVAIPMFVNGTVTSEQTNGTVGDELALKITPAAGYACTSLKVNGRELLANSITSETVIKTVMSAKFDIEATFTSTFVTSIDLITGNNADIDLDADVNGMSVYGYEMFEDENTVYAKDENNLLDISAAKDHKNGWAGDFDSHGWTVVSSGKKGGGVCITGEFDMQVKVVKGMQAIRIFVGGWWMGNHGGVFTLQDAEGNVYAKVTYRSANGSDPNDIFVFNVDTSSWENDESREFVLHFNGNGFDQLPFAGVQILGENAVDSAE